MTACGFRLCSANVILVIEQATEKNDEDTVLRYPLHDIAGLDIIGTCPASLLVAPLNAYDAEHLEERARIIEAAEAAAAEDHQRAKPIKKPPANPPHSRAPRVGDTHWFRPGSGAPYAGPGIGATAGPVEIDFLSSPDPLPTTGATDMSDLRGQLRNNTILTCRTLGEAQEICATITHLAEQIDAKLIVLQEKQNAALALARVSVGESEGLPLPAVQMINGAVLAVSEVRDIRAANNLTLIRTGSCARQNGEAAGRGREYLGLI